MTTILALDLGEKTGWAIWRPGIMVAGVWNLKPSRHEGDAMRLVYFRRNLNTIARSYTLNHVAYEEVRRHLGTDAAHAYGEYRGILKEWCNEHGLVYEAVPIQKIKQFATGSARASKVDMVKAAQGRWQVQVEDDNEADARWLAEYVASLEMSDAPENT